MFAKIHGRIKAWEITYFTLISRAYFYWWGMNRMNKEWMKVFIAAFFEVFWVIGLKHADDVWAWIGTTVAIVVSFYLMIMAGKTLPVGTVYAVFVGLGTAGTVMSDILFFGQDFNIAKIGLILLLLIGVVGLKLVTKEQEEVAS
jgi:paired small multidrug resistance pump